MKASVCLSFFSLKKWFVLCLKILNDTGCDLTGYFDVGSTLFSSGSLPDQNERSDLHLCKMLLTYVALMRTLHLFFRLPKSECFLDPPWVSSRLWLYNHFILPPEYARRALALLL